MLFIAGFYIIHRKLGSQHLDVLSQIDRRDSDDNTRDRGMRRDTFNAST